MERVGGDGKGVGRDGRGGGVGRVWQLVRVASAQFRAGKNLLFILFLIFSILFFTF